MKSAQAVRRNKTNMAPTIYTEQLEVDFRKAAAKLEGQFAGHTHADKTFDRNTVVITPSGSIVALFLKDVLDPEHCKRAYKLCKTVNDPVENRPAATGSASLPRIKKNGRRGAYNAAPQSVTRIHERDDVRQGLLGAIAGTARRPPRQSELTNQRSDLLAVLRPLVEEADHLYKLYLPRHYAHQRAEVKKAPEFRRWQTAFSSLYIPKNFRTGYHHDSANLRGALSVLFPLGYFTGAELVLPRWRIAFALEPGDLLIFDPQELHGNLPIEGERVSVVCYCARNLSGYGKK